MVYTHFELGYISKNKLKFQIEENIFNWGGCVKTDICGHLQTHNCALGFLGFISFYGLL